MASGRKSSFARSKEVAPPADSDVPARLLSLWGGRSASATPGQRRFEPVRPQGSPKLARKLSELGVRPGCVTPTPNSVPTTVNIAPKPTRPGPKAQTGLRVWGGVQPSSAAKVKKDREEENKKALDLNTWMRVEDGQYRPSTLPFFKEAQTPLPPANALIDEQGAPKEKKLLFVQLPSALPWKSSQQPDITQKGDDALALLISKFFHPSLTHIHGPIGKLQVLKSGKVRLVLGGQPFICLSGTRPDFYQEMAAVDDKGKFQFLGPVEDQLVFVPSIG